MKQTIAFMAVITATLAGAPTHAAVTVIGNRPADLCFSAAQTISQTGKPLSDFAHRNAMANCNEALADNQMARERFVTLVNRGTVEASAQNVQAAFTDFNAALTLRPNAAEVYIDRGSALVRDEQYAQARADYDKALALGVHQAYLVYFNRAIAQEKSGNLAGAYADYRQALVLEPTFKPAKDELSRFHVVERISER